MSAEEFETFKRQMKTPGLDTLANSTRAIFFFAVNVRSKSMLERWPGFRRPQLGAFTAANTLTDFYFFNFVDLNFNMHSWVAGPLKNKNRAYFDLAARGPVEQPPPLDAEATERWLSENKKGNIWYDAATRRLLPVHGTRMATLKETELYAVDRVPMAELRRLLREAPVEAIAIPEFSTRPKPHGPLIRCRPWCWKTPRERSLSRGSTEPTATNSLLLQFCYRPLPANPPFHPADEGYEDPYPPDPSLIEYG